MIPRYKIPVRIAHVLTQIILLHSFDVCIIRMFVLSGGWGGTGSQTNFPTRDYQNILC